MEALFWSQLAAFLYAYLGYPIVLRALARLAPRWRQPVCPLPAQEYPSVTMIIPVHNEEAVIGRKLENTAALDYPRDRLAIVVVSDGSTDRTAEIAAGHRAQGIVLLEIEERGGKARALNHGLKNSTGAIICFSDASIMLESGALKALVANFDDPAIGCVSGEDIIQGSGGERLYGLYELGIRHLESSVCSIVGASGSFYAQRRELCSDFPEGLAPDFLSVLNTVERGFRAISEPAARGTMTSLGSSHAEFQRKVRTILRGMGTLFSRTRMLNPFRFGLFAFELLSHKLARWAAPFFLIFLLLSNAFLLDRAFYVAFFMAQLVFYGMALLGWLKVPLAGNSLLARIAVYFVIVNAATLVAWFKFASGVRQEIWAPTRRESVG